MDVIKINDLLSQEDIDTIVKSIKDPIEDNISYSTSPELGRHQFGVRIHDDLKKRLLDIANPILGFESELSGATYTEYTTVYGTPSLPVHFDGDWNDLIINYQLESNISWDIGVGLNLYTLEDNSAVIFHPNEDVHWRPIKSFKDGDFVRMIFFRFHNPKDLSDYSHLRVHGIDADIFWEINELRRNSISE